MGILLTLSLVSSYTKTNPAYTQYSTYSSSGVSGYWDVDRSMCEAGQDFVIQIAPLGCEPAVVRSDLLEEQNVPVFCKLAATKINPLVDVDVIENIAFSGRYPDEVSGIGFHPAKAALGGRDNGVFSGYGSRLNSPLLNNIGYAVIVLKQNRNESSMPEYVEGNLSATIRYDLNDAFGIGKSSFYLPELRDDEWNNKFSQYGFWDSRGYLRAENVNDDSATLVVYADESYGTSRRNFEKRQMEVVSLKEGQTSQNIYLPGFDCLVGMQLKLDDLVVPDTRAKLDINGEIVEVARNERFLDNKCRLNKIDKKGLVEEVSVYCQVDEGDKNFVLKIEPKVKLKVEGQEVKDYSMGDILYQEETSKRNVFLGYIGQKADGTLFVVPMMSTAKTKEEFLKSMDYKVVQQYVDMEDATDSNLNFATRMGQAFSDGLAGLGKFFQIVVAGADFAEPINLGEEKEVQFAYAEFGKNLKEDAKSIGIFITSKFSGNYGLNYYTDREYTKKKIKFESFASAQNLDISDEAKGYYENAINDYETLISDFPAEKGNENELFADAALVEEIKLADAMGQKLKVVDLCSEVLAKDLKFDLMSICGSSSRLSNSEISSKGVLINGQGRTISLLGISEPSFEDYGASIRVIGAERDGVYNLDKDRRIILSETEWFELKEVTEDVVTLTANVRSEGNLGNIVSGQKTLKIKLDSYENIGENNQYELRVTDINLKKIAKVSILPSVQNAETKANFSFRIGIEKREEDLMPDKIEDKIADLNDTINDWNEKSEDLGEVVSGMKKACLGVGAALTVKNFFSNLGGKAIARQNVMRGDGGVYDMCADAVSSNEFNGKSVSYNTIEECMYQEADYIDSRVDSYYSVLSAQNARIKQLQEARCQSTSAFGEKTVDQNCLIKTYSPQVQNSLSTSLGNEIINPNNPNEKILVSDAKNLLSEESWNEGNYNVEEIREIELYSEILKNNPNDQLAQNRLYSTLKKIQTNSNQISSRKSWADDLGTTSDNIQFIETNKDVKSRPYSGLTKANIETSISGVESNDPVQLLQTSSGQKYILILDDSAGNEMYPIKQNDNGKMLVYDDSGNLVESVPSEIKNLYFKKYDTSSYQNKFKSTSGDTEAKVKFYETEPYKGLPAIVPFDLDNGWYAATKQTIPILGNVKAFDDSGRVTSFYVCNVGSNGREEFKSGIGDDICSMVNTGTGQAYNQFPGLEKSEAQKLIQDAVVAIEQASRQYKSGVTAVNINVGNGRKGGVIKVGSPAVDIPDMQCQDFMSPKECQLLFNVCDPVVCPSSRCDFAGAYPVKDVIQSGIIGSIALCLPNFREGIFIPVCLSGIKAGIDAYLSVVTSYRDCLQESLETGQLVGVCDEIYSIHLCEFFWRQGIPLAKLAIPKIIEFVLGQNVHGGAEYLSVQSAWQSAENSVDYFTQYYAANSYKAFKARTAEDVGEEVCQSFASAVYPEGGDILGALTEPDSPPQFHGRFDEIEFSDATNPPISHYKVFYHIYSGKDSRAYYSVYLKGSSGGSFYQDTSQRRIVASGYIPVGEYASETKDFTAPSGYKELCINVNGQEECNFKEVSTSFAVNYVKDKYLEEQASEANVRTEAECVSGSPSLYSALNPNLQEGASDVLNPAIYNRGIIRICATDSPGKGTDGKDGSEGARWVEVGICGDPNMKCWLDTQSVENSVNFASTAEGVLEEQNKQFQDRLAKEGQYLTSQFFEEELKKIKGEKSDSEKISLINKIFDKVFYNQQKAYLYFLRGNAYGNLAILNKKMVEDLGTGEQGDVCNEGKCADEHVCVDGECKLRCVDNEECGSLLSKDYVCLDSRYCDFNESVDGEEEVSSDERSGSKGDDNNVEYLGCQDCGMWCTEKECLEISNSLDVVCNYTSGIIGLPYGSTCEKEDEEGEEEDVIEEREKGEEESYPSAENLNNNQLDTANAILNILGREYASYDTKVKADTGLPSFNCLILVQALQESSLTHCKDGSITCGDSLQTNSINALKNLNIYSGDDNTSFGVKQIHIPSHATILNKKGIYVGKFKDNVEYGSSYLVERYEYCGGEGESNFKSALTAYNSGSNCNKDSDYANKVLSDKRVDTIKKYFEQCK